MRLFDVPGASWHFPEMKRGQRMSDFEAYAHFEKKRDERNRWPIPIKQGQILSKKPSCIVIVKSQ